MNDDLDPMARAAALAALELSQAQAHTAAARSALSLLQHDVDEVQHRLGSRQATQLLQANEQLVISALLAQTDAETATRDLIVQKQTEELRHTGERMEDEIRQLQEASRLKSEFLANMSHELRTPLNAVIGFADLLQTGMIPTDSAKHHEFVGHIASSGRHLLQLINDVLDLSRIEAGKLEFSPEPVYLNQLIKDVIAVLGTSASSHGLGLSSDIAQDLGPVVLDPLRLRQALYNYLSNAIKFTPPGGRVTVRVRAEGPLYFRVEVEDTGMGIAEAELPRLFVEFQQLDSGFAKKHEGTGLGLALTRRLIEAQGGTVGVRSTPGIGSVFHMVLKRDNSIAAPAVGH